MCLPSSRPSLASDAPIGIFDSGIGGLTVAHAIAQAMPATCHMETARQNW